MSQRTYGLTEVVGTSSTGIDDAIHSAIGRAAKTIRQIDWFEVTQILGYVREGSVDHFQVAMKVGFRMEDA